MEIMLLEIKNAYYNLHQGHFCTRSAAGSEEEDSLRISLGTEAVAGILMREKTLSQGSY